MATYYLWSGATGAANGSSWADAYTLFSQIAAVDVAGDVVYVAHDHNETTAGNINFSIAGTVANPLKVICVDRGGSVPPVAADRRTTGIISTTGDFQIVISGSSHWDGVCFTAGIGGTGQAHLTLCPTNHAARYDNCTLRLASTGSTSRLSAGSNSRSYTELHNTTVSFSNVAQGIQIGDGFKWYNTPSAIQGATIPTTLFIYVNSSSTGFVECHGVDLSAVGSGKSIVMAEFNYQRYEFSDCKFDPAVTKVLTQPAHPGGPEMIFTRFGSNYTTLAVKSAGTLSEETIVVRTNGANDGTVSIAWKIVTSTYCSPLNSFECPSIAIWNDTIGVPITATVEGIAAALPYDNECWVEVQYLGADRGMIVTDKMESYLATPAAQTTSSAVWGGSTAPFKLGVTFTPQQKGWIYARVRVGKPSSTFYIDPKVTLS